jgi:hypothetical protein
MEMPKFSRLGTTLQQVGQYMQDKITGHNPIPDLPLEIELLVTAWDNVKKNYLEPELDAELAGTEPAITEEAAEICDKMEELMGALVREFQKKR